ncbi:hypothetical protein Sjap_014876 [Stephania japonica]|uniref:Uncharacterized protein n=1 Tax=Stephania japonica TaxID=461633 RepID=A0AAP0NRX6_9MAGN
MALAVSLHSWAPLTPPRPTTLGGSRIRRAAERRAALQLRSMGIQEQLKPPSKQVTTSRRDTIVFMTGISLAATTLLSADPAAARAQTASIGQQILDKLEMFKEIFGISKSKGKMLTRKEKRQLHHQQRRMHHQPRRKRQKPKRKRNHSPNQPRQRKKRLNFQVL